MDALVALIGLIIEAMFLYFIIESAVKSGNRELIISNRENTNRIIEELKKARDNNEK